jgi:hypothetical protein
VSKAVGTGSVPGSRVYDGVIDDVIIPGIRYAGRDEIKREPVAHPPSDIVVGARGITAYPKGPHKVPIRVIEGEAATKHIDSADFPPHHRIVSPSVVPGVTPVRNVGVNRVAVLQAEQASPGLNRREKVSRG